MHYVLIFLSSLLQETSNAHFMANNMDQHLQFYTMSCHSPKMCNLGLVWLAKIQMLEAQNFVRRSKKWIFELTPTLGNFK